MVTTPGVAEDDPEATPSWQDLRSGAWYLRPDQRPAFYAALSRGATYQQAYLAANDSEYGRHLFTADSPVSPKRWHIVSEWAAKTGRTILSALRELGDLPDTVSAGESPDEARERVMRERERTYNSWLREAAEAVGDPDPDPEPEPKRIITQAQQRAARQAWMQQRDLPPANPQRHSQTPEGRRERYLRALVKSGKYPDVATAERMVPRRGAPD